jgi:hyperosmotically inducible protein
MKTIHLFQQNNLFGSAFTVVCLSALLAVTGCEQQKSPEKTTGNPGTTSSNPAPMTESSGQKTEGTTTTSPGTAAKSAGDYIDDSMITAKVKAAIMNDENLSASRIEVTTDKGVVKLSGTVDTEQGLDKAKILANTQPGVKSVQSELTVGTEPGKK